MWPAIIQAVGGILSTGLNAASVSETNEKNRRMQEQINRRNLVAQREMNAYNSPVAQMARFKAAGINPLAASAGMTSGNQATLPTQEAAQYEAPSFSGFSDAIANSLSYRLQEMRTEAQVAQDNAQTGYLIARTGNENQQYQFAMATFDLRVSEVQNRVNNLETYGRQMESTIAKIDEEKLNVIEARRLITAQFEESVARAGLLDAQAGLTMQEINLVIAQTKTESFKQSLLYQQARQVAADADVSEAYADAYVAYAAAFLKTDLTNEHLITEYQKLSSNSQAILLDKAAQFATYQSKYYEGMAEVEFKTAAAKSEEAADNARNAEYEANKNYDDWQNHVWMKSTQVVTGGIRDVAAGAAFGVGMFTPAGAAAGSAGSVGRSVRPLIPGTRKR